MDGFRGGKSLTLCDTCYRVPPASTMVTVDAGRRSLRAVDQNQVFGEGHTVPIVLCFCNTECQEKYRPARDARSSAARAASAAGLSPSPGKDAA